MGANAQTSVPAFTAGQVLTAAQVTQINTGIPVFASSTERDAAFGGTGEKTLAEGQMAYLEDTNATQYYDGSSWAAVAGGKISQVVSTTKTDIFSASVGAGASTAVTGLSASITPSSASSTVLVMAQLNAASASSTADAAVAILTRGGTAISIGDTAGSRSRGTSGSGFTSGVSGVDQGESPWSIGILFVDSPATTSSTTYAIELGHTNTGTQTVYLNTGKNSTLDRSDVWRTTSTITVMEIAP